MPIKNYYVGSGVNDDYSTIKKWWYDFVTQGSGDLISNNTQVNVYLRGAQQHLVETGTPIPLVGSIFSETRTSFFLMYDYNIYTDENRYFNITAESGYEFYGTFDNPNIPYITPSSEAAWTSRGGIACYVPYTRFSNFIVKDVDFNLPSAVSGFFAQNMGFGIMMTAYSGLIDRVGVQNIRSSQVNTNGTRAYGIYNTDDSIVRNCIVNDVYCSSVNGFSQSIGIAARYNSKILNNTVSNISGYLTGPTGFIIGIGYPTIEGRTIVPPDEGVSISSPQMWFDASVGPVYSGTSSAANATQLATGVDVKIVRWDNLIDNYSGLMTQSSWGARLFGYIDDSLSPKGLRMLEPVDAINNNSDLGLNDNPLLVKPALAGGWSNGYTAATLINIRHAGLSLATDGNGTTGTIISSLKNYTFAGTVIHQEILDLSYSFNNITGTLYATIQFDTNQPKKQISVGPIYSGIWYTVTVTADPYNSLNSGSPGLFLEIEGTGINTSSSTSLSDISGSWQHYTTVSGGIINNVVLYGASIASTPSYNSIVPWRIANTKMTETLLYNNPIPEIGVGVAGRKDLRRYLYNKWIATTGASFILPVVPSGTTYFNNYSAFVQGNATNSVLGMSTGIGPAPSSNAVFDNSLLLVNGNLSGKLAADNINSNTRTAFNPSLLISSPLISAGTNLSGIYGFYHDMGGQSREGLWDIGADEFVIPTITNNTNFTIVGYDTSTNNMNLAITGDLVLANSMTLYVSSIATGGVGMNLTIRNIPATGVMPFTIRGTLPENIPSGGMNLTLLNNQSAFTSIVNPSLPLTIRNAYNTGINNVNLTIANSQTSISSVSQFNLVISGVNPNDINNTLPLIIGAGPTDGFYLNIAGYGGSGNNTLPLVVYNNASPSGMNLSIIGVNSTPKNGNISFSIPYTDPFATNISLAMSGYGYGINNNLTFSIPSIQSPGLPLVIKGGVGTEKTGVIPFWVTGGYGQGMNMTMLGDRSPVLPASLNLVLLGRGNLSNNDVDLSIINSDSGTAGWGVSYQGMNLTMMRNGTGFGNNVNLSIQGQNLNTSGIVNLAIQGTGWTSVTGVVSLFVNGRPAASSLLPMYIRGF